MLRVKPQLSLRNAEEYHREHLRVGDYYAEDQKVIGEWIGVAADKLGLKGAVLEKDFLALCEGRNPETGGRLTQRLNTVRLEDGKLTANRRIYHDFTISPPKSVSVVALCENHKIVAVHERAVRRMMAELEKFAETRGSRETSLPPASGTRRAGSWIRICTPTASSLTRLLIP